MKNLIGLALFIIIFISLFLITIVPKCIGMLWNWKNLSIDYDNYLENLGDLSNNILGDNN